MMAVHCPHLPNAITKRNKASSVFSDIDSPDVMVSYLPLKAVEGRCRADPRAVLARAEGGPRALIELQWGEG